MFISPRAALAGALIASMTGSLPAQPLAPSSTIRTHQVNVNAAGMNIPGDAANEPSIAIDPTAPNRMAIGWRQFDTVASSFREAGNAWSRDGGRTWTVNVAIADGNFRSDPVLASDSEGEFFYLTLRTDNGFTCDLYRSTNRGMTWISPTFAYGGDKAWFTIDTAFPLGRGNIYACWSTCCNPYGTTTFTRSLSNGQFFEPPITIPTSPIWGVPAVGPDGELYIIGGNANPRVVKSVNAFDEFEGPTFTGPFSVPFGGQLVINNSGSPNPGGLCGQYWVAVNHAPGPSRGHVYAAASIDPAGSDPLDTLFSRSTDGGVSWSAPVRVNDDPAGANNWQWFTTLSVSPTGRLDLVWNDTRDGPTSTSRLFYSCSLDGGITWTPNVAISPPWNSLIGWPVQNKIGDYYHAISDDLGVSIAWAATLNGEQDVYFTRIGEDDCDQDRVADSTELSSATDCNGNGTLDTCDIAAGVLTDTDGDGIPDLCDCDADWNENGALDSQDYFDFLLSFFANSADFNDDGVTNSQDYFDYLDAFFAGC
jgi:hypothetical protein